MSGLDPMDPERVEGVIAAAIRRLAADRLRRGAAPLAVLFAYGVAELIVRGVATGALLMTVGALLSGAALVLVAVAALLRARGRSRGLLLALTPVAAMVAAAYGAYLVFYRGIRALTVLPDAWVLPAVEALALTVLGLWVLRITWKLSEVSRLAGTMGRPGGGD